MPDGIDQGLQAPTRVRRVLAYFGLVDDSREVFVDEGRPGASSVDRMLAILGWLVLVVAVSAVRGIGMGLAAAVLLLPSALLPITERDGWLAFSVRHPILFALVGLPVGFFATAIIFSGAPLGFCLGAAAVLAVVSAAMAMRRARQLRQRATGLT